MFLDDGQQHLHHALAHQSVQHDPSLVSSQPADHLLFAVAVAVIAAREGRGVRVAGDRQALVAQCRRPATPLTSDEAQMTGTETDAPTARALRVIPPDKISTHATGKQHPREQRWLSSREKLRPPPPYTLTFTLAAPMRAWGCRLGDTPAVLPPPASPELSASARSGSVSQLAARSATSGRTLVEPSITTSHGAKDPMAMRSSFKTASFMSSWSRAACGGDCW